MFGANDYTENIKTNNKVLKVPCTESTLNELMEVGHGLKVGHALKCRSLYQDKIYQSSFGALILGQYCMFLTMLFHIMQVLRGVCTIFSALIFCFDL